MPKRIDHVAIVVRDLEQALGFYRDVLGIEPESIKEVPTELVRVAFLPLAGPEGSMIELVEPFPTNAALQKFLTQRGEGLHHLCLEVADIDAALADLQAQGASVLDQTPRVAADGKAIFLHPRGTHGVLLELLEK